MRKIRRLAPLLFMLAVFGVFPGLHCAAADPPGQVTSAKAVVVNMSTNTSVVLEWKKVAGAQNYRIYRVDGTTLTRVGKTRKNTYTVKDLEPNTQYYFQVFAYNAEGGEGEGSSIISVKTTNFLSTVHRRYFVATVRSKTKATVAATGKKITLSKGTKIVAHTNAGKKTIEATMADGTVITIARSKIRYGNVKTTTEYYDQNVKEKYINKKGYSSKTKYLIWINQYTCNLTIFKGSKGKWKQVRSADCVIGKGGRTHVGTFKLLKQDTYRGYPRIFFTWNYEKNWGCAIHCRKDKYSRAAESDGCVRLGLADLSYLVAHCELGTTVVSN